MIISVSAVSAAEDIADSADVLAQDDSTTLEADDAVDVQADPEPAAEPAANFTTLQTEISNAGNNLTLEKDYTRVADDNKEIVIDKDFTIDGQGKYILDGNKMGRFFVVNEGSTLTLKGLTLCNGVTQDINNGVANNGGAIFVSQGANLVVENVAFINNTAITNYGQGGAIFSYGNVTIKEGTKFINNSADTAGAIFIKGNLDVTGAEFSKNTVKNPASIAGAIFANGDKVTIKGSSFKDNYAEYETGAVKLVVREAIISSTNFTNNKANKLQAGAVLVDKDCNLTVNENCKFINNTAANGGAIFASYAGKLDISDSEFINNTANLTGGAIYNQLSSTEITGCVFEENNATTAGAVYVYNFNNNGGTTNIKNSEFIANEATGNGGAIFFYDANENALTISDNTKFTNNVAGKTGGALLVSIGDANIEATFTGNNATVNGSAVYIRDTGKANIKNSKFSDNGGDAEYAIYNSGSLALENNTISDKIYSSTEIIKPGSNVTISPITNVTYGNTVVVYYNIVNRSSNVTASVCLDDGNMQPTVETAIIKIIDNETIAITNLTAGKYLIIVFNNEDNNVYGNSSSSFFTVNKADPNLQVTAKVNAVGIIEIDATVDKNAVGNITFKVINETGAVVLEGEEEIENGAAKFAELTVLPKGKYNYTVSYENENYNTTTINSETPLVVDKEVAHIDIKSAEVNEYGMIVIKANITKDATGSVNFYFYNTDTGKNLTVPIEIGENGTIEYDENTPFEKGYYYVQIGYNGDDKYYETIETSTSEDVNVTKTAPAIDVYVSSIENNVTVKVIADNNTVSGKVNITLFDKDGKAVKNITKDMTNGAIEEVTFTGIEIGDYLVRADFLGSDDFYQTFAVNETKVIASTEMNVTATVNQFGQIVVLANLTKGATGTVLFIITNSSADNIVNLTAEILDGTALDMTTDVLAKGFYNVKAIYSGDDYHTNCTAFADVEIAKEVPVIEIINVTVDKIGAIVVNANITKGVSGNVTFLFINTDTGKNLTVPIEIGENGTIEYDELTPFEKGFYTVAITYDGDGKYYGAHEVSYVNVTKTAPTIDVDVSSIENNVTVKVTATNDTVSGKVNITLFDKDGKAVKNITKDMTNGAIEEVTFTGIEIGDYLVRADFLGSDDFYQTFAVNETKVRASTEMNVTTTVNQFGQIVVLANLTKGATGTVLFIITNSSGDNIVNLTAEIDNGTAQDWTTDVLAKGFYSVKAVYSGDDHYATSTKFGDAVIAKEYLNVTSKVSIMDGANQATIVFTFSGNASGNATAFFLNYGTNASYAIQNGTVVIDEIFDSGAQSVLLTYDGDEKYYGFYDVYADFFVKASSFIKVKANPVVYQNNGKVTITLTDNYDGKGINPIANAPVTVTVNGKTYKATTNAKGIATVTIPAKLVPKQYTATVSYAGTNTTVGDKETFKFTVKKATPKLTAKKKTFKSKTKVKKYTIVLKDNKNKAIKKVKVYLKIGKKTYTAKTSSKGKAVFKIKKLTKRGTYKAKVTFKGNKYFNKLTKKATIKVRR